MSVCLSVCLSVNPNRIRLGDNVCLSVFDQHFLSGNNSNTRNKLTHEIINNTIEYGHELEVFDTLRVVMRNRYLIPDMTGYRDAYIHKKNPSHKKRLLDIEEREIATLRSVARTGEVNTLYSRF